MKRKRRTPDTSTYRAAVQAIMETVQRQYRLNDTELADRIGCSASTVRNAKRGNSNLDGVTLAGMEHRFGPGTVDPFLALGGSRATPLPDALPEIDPVLDIVQALHRLIEAQHSSSEHGFLITSRELLTILRELRDARRAFDTLILLAEPGLTNAPAEIRRWFHDTFEKPPERLVAHTLRDEEQGASPGAGPPSDFTDVAIACDIHELVQRYGVSADTIERWLREVDEQLVTEMLNHKGDGGAKLVQ